MVETVVALLMFINGEIKEHRIQDNMATCLRGKRVAQKKRLGQPAGKPRRVEAARRKKRGTKKG